MRAPDYPLFVLEKDDHSFREVKNYEELSWYEPIDVRDRLYEGWDSSGRFFRLLWDERGRKRIVEVQERFDIMAFEVAVQKYKDALSSTKKRVPKHLCAPEYLEAKIAELKKNG